ncbi:MAG: hypothetical protein ACRDF8_01270 [Chloroflexota bacterium]
MNLVALREAVRLTAGGEAADLSDLDLTSAEAFHAWTTQHQLTELPSYEPAKTYALWMVPTRPEKS